MKEGQRYGGAGVEGDLRAAVLGTNAGDGIVKVAPGVEKKLARADRAYRRALLGCPKASYSQTSLVFVEN